MDGPSGANGGLTREQKTGFVLLLVFGLLAIAFGMLQLRNTIYGPFVIHLASNETTQLQLDNETRLQQIDTDHDGLNDYEEVNFYNTSRYLPDTDSDGIGDKAEIDAGTDPLCPEGKACAGTQEDVGSRPAVLSSGLVSGVTANPIDLITTAQSITLASTTAAQGVPPDISAADIAALTKDPTALRQLLLQSGKLSKDSLDKIDDATLVAFATQLARENATSTPDKAAVTANQ